MNVKAILRRCLPQDVKRHYARIAHPEDMARYDTLRAAPVTDPMDMSFRPFLEQRAIFFHIPKTAGISVAQSLFGCRAGQHMLFYEYKRAFSAREFRQFYKFTFVRNPWDRLVSAYHYMRDGGMSELDARQAEDSVHRYPVFSDFVEHYMTRPGFETKLHLRSQWQFICASETAAPELDFVGRFETLAADFATIARRLNRDETLPHRNAGASRQKQDYRSFYTDRTAEIVAQAYARDIALFGYRFEDV